MSTFSRRKILTLVTATSLLFTSTASMALAATEPVNIGAQDIVTPLGLTTLPEMDNSTGNWIDLDDTVESSENVYAKVYSSGSDQPTDLAKVEFWKGAPKFKADWKLPLGEYVIKYFKVDDHSLVAESPIKVVAINQGEQYSPDGDSIFKLRSLKTSANSNTIETAGSEIRMTVLRNNESLWHFSDPEYSSSLDGSDYSDIITEYDQNISGLNNPTLPTELIVKAFDKQSNTPVPGITVKLKDGYTTFAKSATITVADDVPTGKYTLRAINPGMYGGDGFVVAEATLDHSRSTVGAPLVLSPIEIKGVDTLTVGVTKPTLIDDHLLTPHLASNYTAEVVTAGVETPQDGMKVTVSPYGIAVSVADNVPVGDYVIKYYYKNNPRFGKATVAESPIKVVAKPAPVDEPLTLDPKEVDFVPALAGKDDYSFIMLDDKIKYDSEVKITLLQPNGEELTEMEAWLNPDGKVYVRGGENVRGDITLRYIKDGDEIGRSKIKVKDIHEEPFKSDGYWTCFLVIDAEDGLDQDLAGHCRHNKVESDDVATEKPQSEPTPEPEKPQSESVQPDPIPVPESEKPQSEPAPVPVPEKPKPTPEPEKPAPIPAPEIEKPQSVPAPAPEPEKPQSVPEAPQSDIHIEKPQSTREAPQSETSQSEAPQSILAPQSVTKAHKPLAKTGQNSMIILGISTLLMGAGSMISLKRSRSAKTGR